jgi:16S rRNA (cytosine967-C5)-methyltransferase
MGEAGVVLARDRKRGRVGLVARAARRLDQPSIHTLQRDATRSLLDLPMPGSTQEGEMPQFDRVLVDAPCSGIGSIRRNPDARWRVRKEDPARLAGIQRSILDQAAAVLRPGGSLVYSTCTLLPEENEDVVATFLQRHRNYQLVPRSRLRPELAELVSEEGLLRCLPHIHGTDGFFAARLERTP